MPRIARLWFFALGTAALLCWPLALNRAPVFFNDSIAYLSAGRGVWTTVAHATGMTHKAPGHALASKSRTDRTTGGRSPYYGAMAWAARATGGIEFTAVAQALWIALTISIALPRLGFERFRERVGAVVILASCTSVPFFSVTILPDVFGAVAILGVALLWTQGRDMHWPERAFWLVGLAAAMLFHRSFLGLGAALAAATFVVSRLPLRERLRRAAPLAAVVVVALLGDLGAQQAAQRVAGHRVTPIPYLLARVIGDGTGAMVLKEECGVRHYASCRYLTALPLTENGFLWGDGTDAPPWVRLPTELRAAVAAEQGVIVSHAVLHHPLAQATRTAENVGRQLFAGDLTEFAPDHQLSTALAADPGLKPELAAYSGARFWISRDTLLLASNYWTGIYVVSLLLVVAATFADQRTRIMLRPEVLATVSIIVGGVVLNSVINGALAGVMGRYTSRVAWLVVLSGATFALAISRRHATNHETLTPVPQPTAILAIALFLVGLIAIGATALTQTAS